MNQRFEKNISSVKQSTTNWLKSLFSLGGVKNRLADYEPVNNIKKDQILDLLHSLEKDEENCYPFWERKSPESAYYPIRSNTLAKKLSSYERLSINEANVNFLIEKKKIIEEYKYKKFKLLYKTLDNLYKECEEEGFQKFSETAEKNAKQILRFIYSEFPKYEYYIYPTEDREVAVDCNPQKGKGILTLCDSDGGVACFASFDGKNRRFRYDSIDDISYNLLRETFEELDAKKKYLSASPSSGDSFPALKPTELNYNFPKNETYSYA